MEGINLNKQKIKEINKKPIYSKEYGEYLPDDDQERIVVDKLGNSSQETKEYNAEKLKKNVVQFKIKYVKDDEE